MSHVIAYQSVFDRSRAGKVHGGGRQPSEGQENYHAHQALSEAGTGQESDRCFHDLGMIRKSQIRVN